MRHVGHQVGSDLITDLPHSCIVQHSRVGTGTGYDDLGMEVSGLRLQSVIVYESSGDLLDVIHSYCHTLILPYTHTAIHSYCHTYILLYTHINVVGEGFKIY